MQTKTKSKVKPIPKGYRSITPYLIINGAAKAIEFYKKAFGATTELCMSKPDGRVGHAELTIGDSKIMLADEFPEMHARSPRAYGGSPISLHLYVNDVDAIVRQAVAAGAKLERPVENMFYGDRSGSLEDPYGHKWYVSTHVEDVSPEEIERRAKEIYGKK